MGWGKRALRLASLQFVLFKRDRRVSCDELSRPSSTQEWACQVLQKKLVMIEMKGACILSSRPFARVCEGLKGSTVGTTVEILSFSKAHVMKAGGGMSSSAIP